MDKPFRTITEQVSILESRGMATDTSTPSVLKREGYYSVVNGYKDPFIDRVATAAEGDDRYAPGISFSHIARLFSFDRDLRLTMLRYFAMAEAILKTVCAYRFAEAHPESAEAYLLPSSFRSDAGYPGRVDRLISEFGRALGRRKPVGRRRPYIEHYEESHDGTPIWVLVNRLTLGQAFQFYEFMPEFLRNRVARDFSELYAETHEVPVRISPRRLRLAYDHIKDFRNICAHDERLYCARVSPSYDTPFSSVLSDLDLVLRKPDSSQMQASVLRLVTQAEEDLPPWVATPIFEAMGVRNISETFKVGQ